MIEPTQAVKKPPLPEPASKDVAQAERDVAAASTAAKLEVAERLKHVVPAGPTFDVRLDGDTMRLYSEMRDPQTDRLIMRLPNGYKPESEAPPQAPKLATEA